MKYLHSRIFTVICLLPLALSGCGGKQPAAEIDIPIAEQVASVAEVSPAPPGQPLQLPVRYQRPGFFIPMDEAGSELGNDENEFVLKVGANITSTRGPQPLWDVLKRVVTLKGMSVSWASDVDQSVLVDVNIRADDGFFEAIDNLLRQVDYFHEVEDNTVVVKHRMTRQFFVSIPNMKGTYTTSVGGNFLSASDAAVGTEGTVKVASDANEFDVWGNITENLDIIFQQWATTEVTSEEVNPEAGGEGVVAGEGETGTEEVVLRSAARRQAMGDSYYTIDRSVGMITVVAPSNIVNRVESYLNSLKKELYRQVVIEARIIEVFLRDNSQIGLDWSKVLSGDSDSALRGAVNFGGPGGMLGAIYADSGLGGAGSFVQAVSLQNWNFNAMINALNEQGDTRVLSNPKITVMSGHPAVISVGTDVTYVASIEQTIDEGIITVTATPDSVVDGISLGVVASIVDDDTVILHLTPVATEIVGDEIKERPFGAGSMIGLPKIAVRQMSTMVKVDNGEMLIIGGLIDSVERDRSKFAPIVGGIPIIKYLFGVDEKVIEKRELVILLTPRVI